VDDDSQVLECLSCGFPAIVSSDDVIEAVTEEMEACGMEFEVLCETKKFH
jgi:hypothetical protein